MRPTRFALLLLATLTVLSCRGNPQVNRDEFYQSGQRYYKEGRLQEAAIEFRNALQIDPKFAPAHLSLARAYQGLNEHQNAFVQFRRVVELDSDHLEAKLELAKYYLHAGNDNSEFFSKANELAEEILEREPRNLQAKIILANSFAGLKDLERSVSEMESVLKLDPQNLTASLNLGAFQLQLRNKDKAEKTFAEIVAQHSDSPRAHRGIANFYAATRDLEKAEAHFKRALELGPADQTNLYSLVRFYLLTQRPESAVEVFNEAIRSSSGAKEPRWGLANLYLARGNAERGLELLRSLLQDYPNDRLVEVRLAEVYLGLGNAGETQKIVDSLIKRDKNDAEARYLKGMLLVSSNPDAAMEEFDKAVQLKRWLVPAYVQKAALHLKRQEVNQAQVALDEALRFNPRHLGARAGIAKVMVLLRQPENALNQADQALASAPNHVDALAAKGEALLMLRRPEEAKEIFQKLAQLDPRNPFYLHRLGSLEAARDNKAAALAHFRKALEMDPNLADVMNDVVYLHTKDKKYQDALSETEIFAKASSQADVVALLRGRIYLEQQDYAAAENEFRRATELNKDNYQAYILLGEVNVRRNRLDQAMREVDQLIARNDRFAPAFLLKAYYLDLKNDSEGAVQYYKKTLDLSPMNPIAANNLAWIYCQKGQNLETALSLARIARQKEPNNPEYADTLGWIYYKMRNYTLAVDQLLFCVNHGKPTAENYYRLGMAYKSKGDKALARETLRKAIELSRSFPEAQEALATLKELG